MKRAEGNTGLIVVLLMVSGCFQSEAPRPVSQPASVAEGNAPQAPAQPAPDPDEQEASPALVDLAAVLRDDAHPASRHEAVYGLADAGVEADAGFVGQALADPDPEVRRAAIEALTGFEPAASVSYLALALNDTDPRVRQDAVEALGNVGTAEARQVLQQGAIDMDPKVRAAAEQMLDEPERRQR
ncbi:MAG: HEAT repeat domain-containing protein [Steroidobacteraceae bacterium]